MIKIFAGYDPREAQGFHVFMESAIRHTKGSFAIIPLCGAQKDGTNTFTYARFLVPSLCNFKGTAIFLDASDMLVRADLAELAALADPHYAVQVVQHEYRTQNPVKYIGTEMEVTNKDYPRKNWSSVVIWNCEHPKNAWLDAEVIQEISGSFLHRFSWLNDSEIGALPPEWNRLIGEQTGDAKLAHFTLGIPALSYYRDCEYTEEWHDAADRATAVPLEMVKVD